MKVIVPEAAKFENTKIYIHRRSKKEGGEVDGRYIRIGGIFRLGAPDLKTRQFMGIHRNLFVTVNYPEYIKDLLGIAADLPEVSGQGQTTWFHPTSCSTYRSALWYFIPRDVWEFISGDYDKIIKTTSIVSIVKGCGGGIYHLLSFPLLTRKFLRSRYPAGKDIYNG